MTKHIGNRLSSTKKLFLTVIGCIALTLPLLIGAMNAPSSRAQTEEGSRPSFDVISIKLTESCIDITEEAPGRVRAIALSPRFQPGRFSGCSSLKGLIAMAYQLDANDITGGPGWIESANYRIEAKAEGETDTEVLRQMLQSVLDERFGLEFHTETREKEVYALRVAEGGHKLKQAVDENGNPIASLPSMESERDKIEEAIRKGEEPPRGGTGIRVTLAGSPDGGLMGEFAADAIDMNRFAMQLRGMVGRPVVDRTGLTGVYSIKMRSAVDRQLMGTRLPIMIPPGTAPLPGIAPQSGANNPAPSAEPSGPTVFTALKEQLGLKLESDEAPLEHIVIDSAVKPSEN